MSAMRRRRNGKEPSCEPCRLAKIRCDHSKPICGRCRRRALQSQCYYHPAPLTKPSDTVFQLTDDPISPVVTDASPYALEALPTPSSLNMCVGRPDTTGPEIGPITNDHETPPPTLDADMQERVPLVMGILRELQNLSVMQEILERYYMVSTASNVPQPLVLPVFKSVSILLEQYQIVKMDWNDETLLRTLAEAVLFSTTKPIEITLSLTTRDFLTMHTGRNLRLEYLGIAYSIVGRATHVMRGMEDPEAERFVGRMLRKADTCLRIATDIASGITDAMVWLALENVLLCSVAEGDVAESVYRHLGDLSSLVFAMGYHRESTLTSNTPFFLVQTRRTMFSKCHNMDVLLSTRRGRPPRIFMKHSDTLAPLDLTDEEICADPAQQEHACSKLTPDGWNTEGRYCTASSRRARNMSLAIREEALHYEYHPATLEQVPELNDLSVRCRQAWTSLPSHLKYNAGVWDSGSSPMLCVTLLIVRLGFLESDLEILKATERADPRAAPSLVQVALEMLTLISGLGDQRGRSIYIHHEFSSISSHYGIPCAVVLTSTIKKLSRQPPSTPLLPEAVSRSSIIRALSVFSAQLDNISKSKDMNFEVCGRAATAISRTLDEILNAPALDLGAAPAQAMNVAGADLREVDFDPFLVDFDLENWIRSIEGVGTGLEWCTF